MQVLKHPSVERVDHVDLDEFVIEVCREHFPWGSAWEDPRVTLHVADGAEFVRGAAYTAEIRQNPQQSSQPIAANLNFVKV